MKSSMEITIIISIYYKGYLKKLSMRFRRNIMKVMNAKDYLVSKALFTEKEYEWIFPLIQAVVNGASIPVEFIEKHLSQYPIVLKLPEETKKYSDKEDTSDQVSRVLEVIKMKNMGLVEIDKTPLVLNEGLNIFYGKNGSGKSTIYKSLVNSLGCTHIKSETNIHNSDKSACVEIKFLNSKGEEDVISYSGKQVIDRKVVVYDTKKMDFLIEPRREQFEIPVLKQEVFNRVRMLFDSCTDVLSRRIIEGEARKEEIKSNFDVEFSLFESDLVEIEAIVTANKFTDEDKDRLEKLIYEIKSMSADRIELNRRVLATANGYIRDVFNNHGNIKETDTSYELQVKDLKKEVEDYNGRLIEYKKLLKIVRENSIEGFETYIEHSWIGNEKWKEFIISSLDFIATLEQAPDVCPYCHQELSQEAKELLCKYQILKSTAEETLKIKEQEIEVYEAQLNQLSKSVQNSMKLIENLTKIEGFKTDKVYTLGVTERDIQIIINKVKQKEIIDAEDSAFITVLQAHLEELLSLFEVNAQSMSQMATAIKTIAADKVLIQKEIDKLKTQKNILDKDKLIKEYINLSKKLIDSNTKKLDLTALKQKNSSAQNQFSKESYIEIYQEQIRNEYDALHQDQIVKPVYKPRRDDCICEIESEKGSYHVKDIFSEGEIRIHTLAELFAEASLSDFKGVYIFDDPVNSLDESNIEYVAKRIKELVKSGNQVIIFTHNILFLNELVDIEKVPIINIEKLQWGTESSDITVILEEQKLSSQSMNKRRKRITEILESVEAYKAQKKPEEMRSQIMHVYSEISGYLEDYFERILLEGIIARHRNNIRMHSILKLKNINEKGQLDTLNELYGRTSKYCSRHSQAMQQKSVEYKDLLIDIPKFKELVGWK
jgi:predicted ATPase